MASSAANDMDATPLQAPASRKRQAAPLDPADIAEDGPVSMDHDRIYDADEDRKAASGAPVKGILRTEGNAKRRGLQWNEQNLQQNEEEKVPRMKIEEPPTPYHHYDSDADTGSTHSPATPQSPFKAGAAPTMADVSPEKILHEALRRRANQERRANAEDAKIAAVSIRADEPTPISEDDADEEDSEEVRRKHEQFQRMRKAHYHMEVLPRGALRSATSMDADVESDDTDDETQGQQGDNTVGSSDDERDGSRPANGTMAPAPSPRQP